MCIGGTSVITFDTVLLKESLKGDDRAGSLGREVILLPKEHY